MRMNVLVDKNSKHPFIVTQYLVRHAGSSDQHMKTLVSLREDLHASWREPAMRNFTQESNTYLQLPVIGCNTQKTQSESHDYVPKITGFFTHSWRIEVGLENYFAEHGRCLGNKWKEYRSADHIVEYVSDSNDSEGSS